MVLLIYHPLSFNSPLSLHVSALLRVSTGISIFPLIFRANGKLVCLLESPVKYLLFFVDLIAFAWIVLSSNVGNKEKKKTVATLVLGAMSSLILGSLYFVNTILLR
eukprot:TRINITY_DN11435_c0_g1_i1.p1 TRINITY_DN11435_c0_g1~~TRINITY_DN11435_c0_g1_i1.p1  ORF type:complete len:106 (-),score=5.44 TRINITY_DN11435_c0_g1_i1:205-522(-)